MKTKKMLISIGIVLGFAGLCFAKGAEAIGTNTIEPVLVFEYKFDEPIVDVIFDEATMTVKEARALGMRGLEGKKATETVKMQYPKVLVTEKAVKFLDEKRGRVKRSVPLKRLEYKKEVWERPMVSLKTEKIVITGSEGEGEKEHSYLRWIDERGKEVKKISYGGEFGVVLMSGDGRYIVAGEGTFILYDINGKELWEKNIGVDCNEGAIHILYDGKVAFVGEQYPDRKPKISVINPDGSINWEYSLPVGHYGFYELFSTKDRKILLYMCKYGKVLDDHIYYLYGFNEKGDLLWQPKEYKGFYNRLDSLNLSKDSHFLCVKQSDGKRYEDKFWLMDINNGNILWENDKISGEISPDGKYLLVEDTLLDPKTGQLLKKIKGLGGTFLGSDNLWRMRDNKIEIFNISDILKNKN